MFHRIAIVAALFCASAVPASAQNDTVKVTGIGRPDTTCFVFPEDGGMVTASRCTAPADTTTPPAAVLSHAYGRWAPELPTECSKELHDAYAVVGPDNKLYPTWHPPVHPSGCHFGHEHGRDPSGSDLFASVAPLALGQANEILMDAGGPTAMRHEDHVGHKFEWQNDVATSIGGAAVTCDIMVKLHQGTHSKDAFTNNVHELFYMAKCANSAGVVVLDVDVRALSPIGPKGEFTESCNLSNRIIVGPSVPTDSPKGEEDSRRRIPTVACMEQGNISEQWSTFTKIITADGKLLADYNPYLVVNNPSRVYDATATGLQARPGGEQWNSPASPYRGDNRRMVFNRLTVTAVAGDVWYTDAYGRNAVSTPFPNSIRQVIRGTTAANTNGRIQYLGARSGDFSAPGVRAPN